MCCVVKSLVAGTDNRLPLMLLALTAVTGVVDAVSILALGRVFVANMTGNVVFIGFALAGWLGSRSPPHCAGWLASLAAAPRAESGVQRSRLFAVAVGPNWPCWQSPRSSSGSRLT